VTRAALLLPGRGSYTERQLESLDPADARVQRAESLRARYGLEPLLALDGAERFEAGRHLRPANVSALIWLVSVLDAERAAERYELVAVGGNSMGWYTALAVTGALSFEDGFRLVQEMALEQEDGAPGGQVLYPLVGDDWRPDPERAEAVARALGELPGEVFPSIRLGGYVVLAGSTKGVSHLLGTLPPVTVGKTRYPFRLAQHGPYHTALASDVAHRARTRLADLTFRPPRVPLIDGRGVVTTPWSADVDLLRAYTLREQIEGPYDFSASVRVALREYAPDRVVLTGPGNSLGGVVGQVLCAERWRGVQDKAGFDALQSGPDPLVESMRRQAAGA